MGKIQIRNSQMLSKTMHQALARAEAHVGLHPAYQTRHQSLGGEKEKKGFGRNQCQI